ncbi:hypothetical protein B0H13DRAFT_2400681, partial [Mycena leptocephala]
QPLAVGFPVFFRIVDGRCTPPDFLSNLLFDSDHDVVMMSSLQPRPGSALLSPSAVEDVYPPPQTWIHGGWYTRSNPPPGLVHRLGGLGQPPPLDSHYRRKAKNRPISMRLRCAWHHRAFGIHGQHRRSVLRLHRRGALLLFTDGHLRVHRMEFASPQEFLQHALQEGGDHMPDLDIPLLPGTNLNWW